MKPIDMTKFRKKLTDSIPGISIGTRNPTDWLSFGHYGFNWLMSGDFYKGFPLGKVMILAGESGAGKSFLLAEAMKDAQKQGMYILDFDSENAHDEEWLERIGFNTQDDKFIKMDVSMVDQVAKGISEFIVMYKDNYGAMPLEERPKVLMCVDSLGMLMTPTDVDQFQKGDMKGDMGRQAGQLKRLVRNCVVEFGLQNIGMIATTHTSVSQDMFNPDDRIVGGCLIPGTLIQTPNGLVEIQNLNLGDIVDTLEGPKEVVNTWHYQKSTYTLEFEDGYILECSPEHKLFVISNNEVIETQAQDLQEGNNLLHQNATQMLTIQKIERRDEVKDVYDIEVKDAHHYILKNGIVSHNSGPIFAASMVGAMKKWKLKVDENGEKSTNVQGIRSAVTQRKSRYNVHGLFKQIDVNIDVINGLRPYSGLFDLFTETLHLLTKEGNRYKYIDLQGKEHMYFRKNIPNELYELIMREYPIRKEQLNLKVDEKALANLADIEKLVAEEDDE